MHTQEQEQPLLTSPPCARLAASLLLQLMDNGLAKVSVTLDHTKGAVKLDRDALVPWVRPGLLIGGHVTDEPTEITVRSSDGKVVLGRKQLHEVSLILIPARSPADGLIGGVLTVELVRCYRSGLGFSPWYVAAFRHKSVAMATSVKVSFESDFLP